MARLLKISVPSESEGDTTLQVSLVNTTKVNQFATNLSKDAPAYFDARLLESKLKDGSHQYTLSIATPDGKMTGSLDPATIQDNHCEVEVSLKQRGRRNTREVKLIFEKIS